MSTTMERKVRRARHPGNVLKDFIETKGLTQREFAKIIEKSPTEVNYIIKGSKNINIDFAIRFSLALDTSIDLWIGMQKDFDLFNAYTTQAKEYETVANNAHNFSFA